MGRKKQSRPRCSLWKVGGRDTSVKESNDQTAPQTEGEDTAEVDTPFFVDVDRSSWASDEHLDISEIILIKLNLASEFSGYNLSGGFYSDSRYYLRFRLNNVNKFIGRMKLGHWPVVASSSICLEFVEKRMLTWEEEMQQELHAVMVSGILDGPDEGVSGLLHLTNLKFLTLRPTLGVVLSESLVSLALRVEMLKSAFDACDSLLDNTRPLWKKSMICVMAWLRPEVMTSETRYRVGFSVDPNPDSSTETGEDPSTLKKRTGFNIGCFYEAIKPSKEDPMLEDDIPDLLPKLRAYQRRAAYWMVQRETGMGTGEGSQLSSPLCMPIDLIDSCSRLFYNPYSGNISLHLDHSISHVYGGILADEMGLGKTVELLACIFSHPRSASEACNCLESAGPSAIDQQTNLKRLKRERVECICGAVSESSKYKGLWVQCDMCDAWQHADCVGYSAKGRLSKARECLQDQGCIKYSLDCSKKGSRRRDNTQIVMMDGDYICQFCTELIQAADSPIVTGATLIVCPAPILSQWHAEIIRHTRPGSLKTFIYEGVRNTSLSNMPNINVGELLTADVVLTTYDVLKEDLSHDSDRHEGDLRNMRFQKRYPVIPTFLTRIFWWRICLDEAQMVESNATAAAEMALRLHGKHRWCITGTPLQRKLDDLYGLLRFLKACPFDIHRWWIEVMKDPYELGDAGAVLFTHNFFKQIMWRNAKENVRDELELPPQEECLCWLSFSPIEEHFYRRQHETCVTYACEVINNFKDDIIKRKESTGSSTSDLSSDPFINNEDAGKLLNSLLKLRQACCHPQVGSSGLRSLQQSPMTMEEILLVLVGKTKVEGEEALRRAVVALNGLAGIAILEQKFDGAVSFYKEALRLAEEHSEDFRLDPLLNIHIHHNLAELIPSIPDQLQQPRISEPLFETAEVKASKTYDGVSNEQAIKRQKLCSKDSLEFCASAQNSGEFFSKTPANALNCDKKYDAQFVHSNDGCLRTICENLKRRFLSVFYSKLSSAQEEFRKSFWQVANNFGDKQNHNSTWWLEALYMIEKSKVSSNDLIRKIGDAISGTLNTSKTSRIASCFQSITGLEYFIQTTLDELENSRKTLLDRLLEIDQTMENPREEDFERVRRCPNCYANSKGPLCVHCELDELFQAYEARLFRLNKGNDGGLIASAEEAVGLQKRKSALNRFLWTLSWPEKYSSPSNSGNEDLGRRREIGDNVVVSKNPSEVEIILGIIKTHSKAFLSIEAMSFATKHISLLEMMRKEYAQARSLSTAQAQVLRAHDELKMATSRLRFRENEDDKSIDALIPTEIEAASAENSSEKFLALAALSRIRGQLRYLKGLVQSKQNFLPLNECDSSSTCKQAGTLNSFPAAENNSKLRVDEEACPVCQEKLSDRKMVFHCGHFTCCKCLFAMTEQRFAHPEKFQDNWVMCPTCRQCTDFQNIAYVDDGHDQSTDSSRVPENSESSVCVNGSYSTKIEAITRRISWINATNPKAKILVFSSWNDVLDVLEHAFVANSITCIRMKGGRKSQVAINQFKGQTGIFNGCAKVNDKQPRVDAVQVLLLLIQHGANGLNLLEAQHVILVEPLLNPAAEAQAISRVHRIGQANKTFVHRFMVKNTVEESIYRLNQSRSSGSYISRNKKNQDQPVLTIKDIESLFKVVPSEQPKSDNQLDGSLMRLPPSVAAAIFAERRLMDNKI